MANVFETKNNTPVNATQGSILAEKYNKGIHNLLLVVAFTAINIFLLVTNANTYFLFSAFVPYLMADAGMYYTGMYPEEYYYDAGSAVLLDKSFFTVMMVIAVVILALYLLCWFFARKQKIGWVIAATVMFGIDTVVMLLLTGISSDMIIDIVFHGWVIVALIMSITNYFKLKKLPAEEIIVPAEEVPVEAIPEVVPEQAEEAVAGEEAEV